MNKVKLVICVMIVVCGVSSFASAQDEHPDALEPYLAAIQKRWAGSSRSAAFEKDLALSSNRDELLWQSYCYVEESQHIFALASGYRLSKLLSIVGILYNVPPEQKHLFIGMEKHYINNYFVPHSTGIKVTLKKLSMSDNKNLAQVSKSTLNDFLAIEKIIIGHSK